MNGNTAREGWLGFSRMDSIPVAADVSGAATLSGGRGPLRGITRVRWTSLGKATALMAVHTPIEGAPYPEGHYYVFDPDKPDEGEWVNLYDPLVDRCHCFDFVTRSDEYGPCKHLLAALIAAEDPHVLQLVEEKEKRDRIARALTSND